MTDEELKRQLASSRSPERKFEIYMQACRDIQYDRPPEAIVLAKQARSIAKKMKDADKDLHALRMVGICLFAENNYEGAFAIFEEALTKYRRRKDQAGQSRALQNMGLALRGLGRHEEALQHYRESEMILRAIGDEEILAKILNNIGSVRVALSHPAEALEAFSECLMISERRGDAMVIARLMGNIADVYMFVGDSDISIEWSKRALEQHRKNADVMGVGITLANLGRVLRSRGDFTGALAVSTESLTVMSSMNDASGMARSMIALSELYMEKKHYAQAATFAEDAMAIFTETKDLDRSIRCLHVLTRISIHRSKYDLARAHIRKARSIARNTDNHQLHTDIEMITAEIELREGHPSKARKHLLSGMKIADGAGMASAQANVARELAALAALEKDYHNALKFERIHMVAQKKADDQLRARHGQALQMRLDIERSTRAREATEHQNDRLAFELNSKERELNTSAIAIAQKNELLTSIASDLTRAIEAPSHERVPKLRSLLHQVEGHRRMGEDWKNFSEQLNNVHDQFFRSLAERCSTLTPSEIKMASLLKLNLSSKEIAEILSLALPTVEVYRHRLRKKLEIPAQITLTAFFQSL